MADKLGQSDFVSLRIGNHRQNDGFAFPPLRLHHLSRTALNRCLESCGNIVKLQREPCSDTGTISSSVDPEDSISEMKFRPMRGRKTLLESEGVPVERYRSPHLFRHEHELDRFRFHFLAGYLARAFYLSKRSDRKIDLEMCAFGERR